MEVNLTPDQEAFVQLGLQSGRFQSPEDAVAEALLLWEVRERARLEVLEALDHAEASFAAGYGREITGASMAELAAEVKRRGRARLDAEPTNPR